MAPLFGAPDDTLVDAAVRLIGTRQQPQENIDDFYGRVKPFLDTLLTPVANTPENYKELATSLRFAWFIAPATPSMRPTFIAAAMKEKATFEKIGKIHMGQPTYSPPVPRPTTIWIFNGPRLLFSKSVACPHCGVVSSDHHWRQCRMETGIHLIREIRLPWRQSEVYHGRASPSKGGETSDTASTSSHQPRCVSPSALAVWDALPSSSAPTSLNCHLNAGCQVQKL
jgi:hypothetical protein